MHAMIAPSTADAPATLNWMAQEDAPERRVCRLQGAWNAQGLAREPNTHLPAGTRHVTLDASATTLDTPGALLLVRSMAQWQSAGATVDASGLSPPQQQLLDLVRQRALALPPAARRLGLLGDIGRATLIALDELRALLAFVGELVWRGAPLLLQPWRVRWREVIHEIDAAGLRAIGIIGLLSFLIGMVMAYQAGATLATYGANILIVNLVSIITLRELGPLLTAILVAGRTGSSYTAQIGTMRITEEVDALRALGLSPFEMLVLPKVIALVITLPLLALFADVMGLAGGGVVAAVGYGVPLSEYVARIPQVVGLKTLVLGLVKAPVFAVVIALVGCMQGLRVAGSAAAVGRATTVSVVQAIFLVIVIDASFSVLYNLLHL
ncbi:putative ABC-type transport system, permease component [Thiomonas arsenitoxydans]|uniref:ABC-type transport system, permease component n=2 Tax=Thiomonas arsenitoxydans (strain DSM 22701 / CIP 110005 / 3As) TaxID=426114 RepID=D6CR14_THIA3|nr:putative ABC-type transport system, permease component [Thiomonas arsenitoxydans]CQR27672.1 putative ABC-type transport system, permease component [Thiomonas arsenitoxydans]CQR29852.1 putative ABC-type transport system, permease component [Thiomonas arsenitoxydans]CQR36915.1 putative ABC-type transport system, permease component [Thiomonas arsenitoxydans]CQR37034.1 putative ABC-type transport system, permease component [Thiomonas arsenitoxydans]